MPTFHCSFRPVAGYINFCPLALESEQDNNQVIAVAMHELTHALVRPDTAQKAALYRQLIPSTQASM